MPIPPVIPQHYDNMWDVLNMTRPRLNDSLKSLEPTGGQILQESDAFTHQIAISGWRRVQSRLAELGYTVPQSEESPFLIDCFLILDSEIKRLQAAKLERDRANGR